MSFHPPFFGSLAVTDLGVVPILNAMPDEAIGSIEPNVIPNTGDVMP
jgi:hypothetical protein